MADETAEKTEKPSPKKLKDAREKGQVARSRDLSVATASLAATGVLAGFGYLAVQRLQAVMAQSLIEIGRPPLGDVQPGDLVSMLAAGAGLVALLVGPVALAGGLVGVGTAIAQGGLVFAPSAMQPDLKRLSPSQGLAKLKPSMSGIDMVKAVLTTVALGVVAWQVGGILVSDVGGLVWTPFLGTALIGWETTVRLLWALGFTLLVLGGADYGIQRWRHMKGLKMSQQEMRDEGKSSEGSPEVKGRIRKLQRDMARARMLDATKDATVVITNPTHFAVALEYKREKSAAPMVVAKGQDLVAARIREIARAHGVPIIENPVLARSLYAEAEVGQTIPAELFSAVAEVLAYLIRIKQLML